MTTAYSQIGYREVNRGLIVGALISTVLIGAGIVISGKSSQFLSIEGFLIVVGGTLGATLVNFSLHDITQAWRALTNIIFEEKQDAHERLNYLVKLSQAVRQNGVLILEREASYLSDPFLKKAMGVTADGQEPVVIRKILETDMRAASERAFRGVQVFHTMGNYAPALGLVGTLIGLVQMMGSLTDPSTVGPAMAIALLATLYGVVLANVFFIPIAGKIKNQSEEELLLKTITLEGMLSIRRDENPMMLEQRLEGFLPNRGYSIPRGERW